MPAQVPLQPCGATLAYSYFSGYLKIFMSNLKDDIIEEFCSENNIDKLHPEMIVLIPDKCNPPSKISDYDPQNIHYIGKIRTYADASGTINRPYDADVYKITQKESSIFVMLSIPASLLTIHKMQMDPYIFFTDEAKRLSRTQFIFSLDSFLALNNQENVNIMTISSTVPQPDLSKKIFDHIMRDCDEPNERILL